MVNLGSDRMKKTNGPARPILAASILAGFLTGCAVGPDFERPAAPDVSRYTATPLSEQTVSSPGHLGNAQHFSLGQSASARWWQSLGSSKLNALIEQALFNVMENAAKFSPPGEPVRVQVRRTNDDQLQIDVSDRGPGIPREIRENLFTPFFTTKSSGMGMGLNICRSIVEFHRGRLWFEDNPEGGTVFIISLPVIKP